MLGGYRGVRQSEQVSTSTASGPPTLVQVCVCVRACVFGHLFQRPSFSLETNNSYCLLPIWDIFTTLNWWLEKPGLLSRKTGPPMK